MRIGVIADTHNRPVDFLVDRLEGVDEIWHLGDVCDPSTLDPLLLLAVPLRIVRGNNDFDPAWPLTLSLSRGGLDFHLVHVPPIRAAAGIKILLHGHTHVPRDEFEGGVRYLNPGSACMANKGAPQSFAFLDLDGKGGMDWKVELV